MSTALPACRYTVIHYKPSIAANVIIGAIYVLWGILFSVHQYRWRSPRIRGWNWIWVLVGGSILSGMGYFIRTTVDPCNFKLGTFIIQQFFIILTPCFFIAFTYAIFGRFLGALQGPQLTRLSPNQVYKVFVWSDVITFLIQGGASGLTIVRGSLSVWGQRLFIVGLGLQLLSYLIFSAMATLAHYKAMADNASALSHLTPKAASHARRMFWATDIANVCYLIRCTFRTLEYALGTDGVLARSEYYQVGLDAVPILLALGVWLVNYPIASFFELHAAQSSRDSPTGLPLVGTETRLEKDGLELTDNNGYRMA